jgi:predicted DNA-binding antitoxin AbrB/MazE fold protein
MTTTLVTAVYENGQFRPLSPLVLPEHTRVQLQVLPVSSEESPVEHRRRVHEVLVAAGLSLPTESVVTEARPLSNERREELARILAAGGPLSEAILTERDGR